jgi:glycosyltransferase involved in cell wall biosynthesis
MILGIEAAHANKKNRTGVEEYCWQIIQELKGVIPSAVRVVLYSSEPLTGPLGELPPNWENRVLPWGLKKGWSQIRLAHELWRNKPDLFFAPGQLVPFWSPKKTVTMIHDSAFEVVPSAYGFFSRWYLRLMNRLILKCSSLIITSTNFNAFELKRLYPGWRLPEIAVIPLAYDTTRYFFDKDLSGLKSAEEEAVLKKYQIKKPFILSVGRLEEKKNTRRIIEAFDQVKNKFGSGKHGDLQLVLVGNPGRGYELIEEALQKSKYSSDIIRPGYVENEEIAVFLKYATLFLFPSKYEGFGIPVLEAMASGCPVIISDAAALPEVAGGAALAVDPNDETALVEAILTLCLNPAERERYHELGLRRVKDFYWKKTALATWGELYRSLD